MLSYFSKMYVLISKPKLFLMQKFFFLPSFSVFYMGSMKFQIHENNSDTSYNITVVRVLIVVIL